MTHDELVGRAVRWLKSTGRCGVAVPELVTYATESPDAVGWRDQGSTCIVIECKASRADFLADRHKPARRNPEDGAGHLRYYMALPGIIKPDDLCCDPVEGTEARAGSGWGLLEIHGRRVMQIVAPSRFTLSDHNRKSDIMMYSLLRRVEIRGNLRACLALKWGGSVQSRPGHPPGLTDALMEYFNAEEIGDSLAALEARRRIKRLLPEGDNGATD